MNYSELFHTISVRLVLPLPDGNVSTGSGCFLILSEEGKEPSEAKTKFFILTNKHVVSNGNTLHFKVNYRDSDLNALPMQVDNLHNFIINHPDPLIDLCLINITEIMIKARSQNLNLEWKFLSRQNILSATTVDEIKVVENILMVGYPNSLMDETNNKPLIRSGITATKATIRFNGNKEFLVDLPCYPGSSGSPVFIAEESRISKNGSINFGNPFFIMIGVVKNALITNNPALLGHHIDIGTAVNYEAINELLDLVTFD